MQLDACGMTDYYKFIGINLMSEICCMNKFKKSYEKIIGLRGAPHLLALVPVVAFAYVLYVVLLPATMGFIDFMTEALTFDLQSYYLRLRQEEAVKMAEIASGNYKPSFVPVAFVILLIGCGILLAANKFVGLLTSNKSAEKPADIELAISALREIQVKALELPNSSQHDAHVIGALAVTVEKILTKEKEKQNA